jgi:molecular chaperone GrpE
MEDNVQTLPADAADAPATETSAAAADALAEAQQERANLQDRVLRLQAEFDNFRKRTERERMEFAEYAGEQTVRALLPVLDDFERALKARTPDVPEEFIKGIELIYSRLLETLKKQGLEPMETDGVPFDPHQHQAIQRLETDEHEDNTVVQEFQRGYNFRGRLLRPAMVQVAVKP